MDLGETNDGNVTKDGVKGDVKRGVRLPESYLGPKESYMQGE